jgi:molybdopterin synthase catalytic subunit
VLELTFDPIDPRAVEAAVAHPGAGALCTFLGVVRDHNLGRDVGHLEYEAFPEMALATMDEIRAEVEERWPGASLAMVHRLGRLEIGVASVVISVSTPHRAEAFAACHYAIDALKTRVPIWKKEVWADGSAWIEGTPPAPTPLPSGGTDAS